ncbi:MAG: DUF721 domain-containing protein [Flavobacteriaceae bacterium]|nr:DUF721 domain-containing protein [Flavobacteriaceae bacterium]
MIEMENRDVPERKEKKISDVIQRVYNKYRITQKMDEIELVKVWEDIVGELIARHTSSISMKGKTLYVTFDQAPLKNEMFLQKELIIKAVNERMGEGFLKKIFIG